MTYRLIIGLGNPGPEYAKNRHNAGFLVVERYLESPSWKSQWKGLCHVSQGRHFLLPQTFMNSSGESVKLAVDFLKIPIPEILVIHDELDFDLGRVSWKAGGGHGGHNGLRSIISELKSNEFHRLRVGIGRPEDGDVLRHVLSDCHDFDLIIDRAIERLREKLP